MFAVIPSEGNIRRNNLLVLFMLMLIRMFVLVIMWCILMSQLKAINQGD